MVRLVQIDVRRPLPFPACFDCVLLDAPCSGLGTIRRDPDIRWRREEDDLRRLATAQKAMIRNAAEVVRPGGRLVYATCSSEPEENDEVVNAFLESDRRFVPLDLRLEQAKLSAGLAAVLDSAGRLRTLPHVHGLEAFFGVVLRREGSRSGAADCVE